MPDALVQQFLQRAGLTPSVEIDRVVEVLRSLPYGRPQPRTEEGVVSQWKGTCSTKHMLLFRCLRELVPRSNPRLIHRVYRVTAETAGKTFGTGAAQAVPPEGLIDVHTYLVAALDGRDVVLDVTFPGPEWDGVSNMPVAAAEGEDLPAGADPAATKAMLVEKHCDATLREPFLAALSG